MSVACWPLIVIITIIHNTFTHTHPHTNKHTHTAKKNMSSIAAAGGAAVEAEVDAIIEKLLTVRGARPGKAVQLLESGVCVCVYVGCVCRGMVCKKRRASKHGWYI